MTRATTVIAVKHRGGTAMAADGQVTMNNTVVKNNACKLRRMHNRRIIAGFAGASAGLLCGGVAAMAYGLSCTETAPVFVATWYSLGMALPAVLGGLLGPWVLRWR